MQVVICTIAISLYRASAVRTIPTFVTDANLESLVYYEVIMFSTKSTRKKKDKMQLKDGSVVQIIPNLYDLREAFERGTDYVFNPAMSNIIGKVVTVVGRPRDGIFGLPSSEILCSQSVWWYPFSAIESIVSVDPLDTHKLLVPPDLEQQPDERSLIIVSAFMSNAIRRIGSSILIPRDIFELFVTYYHDPETFAMTPECVQLDHGDLFVSKKASYVGVGPNRWDNTSFGKQEICVLWNASEPQYRCEWKFQMIRARHSSFIGITTSRNVDRPFFNETKTDHYAYRTLTGEVECKGQYKSYGEPLVTADTLIMELDTNAAKLRFQRNDDVVGGWIDVEKTDGLNMYMMAVSICSDDEIALVDFKRTLTGNFYRKVCWEADQSTLL